MGPALQLAAKLFPGIPWLDRANLDFNEAFNYAEAGGRNSYWFLNPSQLRADIQRPSYKSYFKVCTFVDADSNADVQHGRDAHDSKLGKDPERGRARSACGLRTQAP